MYFEKGNNKKNHKIPFSITLAIILFAASSVTAISISSDVTKDAFAQNSPDPVTNCFLQKGSNTDKAYQQAWANFDKALPNDQVLTKLNGGKPIQNEKDLYNYFTQGFNGNYKNQLEAVNTARALLQSSGFTSPQVSAFYTCFFHIIGIG